MRLIDADALKLAIERYLKKILSHKFLPIVKNTVREVGNDMIFAIDVQQTVDAAPVKHGHWIKDGKRMVYQCSKCHGSFQEIGYGFNFCPECGTKMDEVTE